MNDQPTTTEEAVASRPATTDELRGEATTPAPRGTRELRDAQASGDRPVAPRPAIRAEGEGEGEQDVTAAPNDAPLFDEAAGGKLRERWVAIQTEFVDEPRGAVEKADALVAEVLKQLTETFASEREQLEAGWSRSGTTGGDGSGDVSTEELRQAIQRYRSFFNRLLTL